MVVTRKAHEFIPESNFLSWARSIARYEILAARRQKSRTQPTSEALRALEALEAACPEDFADDHRLAALTKCMEKLAPRAREIMRLRYDHEQGPTEIARLLNRSVNSINVALAKARVSLRACVDHHPSISQA